MSANRLLFLAITLSISAIASAPLLSAAPQGLRFAQVAPPLSLNFGRPIFNVIDFGADPTGRSVSTAAFQAAFNASSGVQGAKIFAPAGTYKIDSHIMIYNVNPGSGGPTFFGAGYGSTTINYTNPDDDVFESCPAWTNVRATAPPTPSATPPFSGCPAMLPTWTNNGSGGSSVPGNPASPVSGLVFEDFSISHSANTVTGGSDFDFPDFSHLAVTRVATTHAWNEFDLGDYNPGDWSYVDIDECIFDFQGHFAALHGSGLHLTVSENYIHGNKAEWANPYSSVAMDISDTGGFVGGTISGEQWQGNDLEGVSWGWFYLLPGNVSEVNAFWTDNLCDGAAFACFLLEPITNVGSPVSANLRITNPWFTAGYTPIYLDGGNYIGSVACCNLQVRGGNISGNNGRGTAQSFFMIQGTPAPGDQIGLAILAVWPGTGYSTPTPFAYVYTTVANDTAQSVAQNLANAMTAQYASPVPDAIDCTSPGSGQSPTPLPYQAVAWQPTPNLTSCPAGYGSNPLPVMQAIGSMPLANLNLGLVEMKFWTPPPPPSSGNPPETYGSYEVTIKRNSSGSGLTIVESPSPRCSAPAHTYPASAVGIVGTNCYDGTFDPGDGIALRNGANAVDISGAQVQSGSSIGGGAAIHMWNAQQVRADGNTIGQAANQLGFVGIWVDSATGNFSAFSNDLFGSVFPILYNAPSAPSGAQVFRSNRGGFGSTVSSTSLPTSYTNEGPFDCTFYITANTSSLSSQTIQYSGATAPAPLQTGSTSVFLPVGATYTYVASGGSPTWSGICLP